MKDVEWEKIYQAEKLIYSSLTGVNENILFRDFAEYWKHGMILNGNNTRREYYSWASRSKEEITEIVLASAAIPVIKKSRKFEGRYFVDGGFLDNAPAYPLVKDGFRNIIVVHLTHDKEKARNVFENSIKELDVSGINFYHVIPSKELGDMCVAFSILTDGRMNLGYRDAAEQLKDILE